MFRMFGMKAHNLMQETVTLLVSQFNLNPLIYDVMALEYLAEKNDSSQRLTADSGQAIPSRV